MINLIFPFRLISKDNEKIFNRQGRPFLSKKFKDFANQVAWEAKKQYNGKLIESEVSVEILAYFKNKRHCDAFNLPKGVLDSLNGIIWRDDRQIKSGEIHVFEGIEKDYFIIKIEILADTKRITED